MVQTLKRPTLVIIAVAVVGGLLGSAALAATGKGRIGARFAARGGIGALVGPRFGGFGGPGFGIGPNLRFGLGPGGPGGGGVLSADVLTPAASFLGFSSASALAADLKGGKTLADEATAKGKTASALVDAIVAAQKSVLDNDVAAGWLTDAQETSMLARFKGAVANLVNSGPQAPAKHPGPLDAAATYLGIGVADLQADLKAGKTLADEATAKGKTVDGLVSALTAQAKTNLDAAVTAGKLPSDQEQTLLTNLTKRVTDLVNNAQVGSKSMTRMRALFQR